MLTMAVSFLGRARTMKPAPGAGDGQVPFIPAHGAKTRRRILESGAGAELGLSVFTGGVTLEYSRARWGGGLAP